jgi:phosphocarrier protein
MSTTPTLTRCVTVANPHGLHARPANALVHTANQFDAQVLISKDGESVDGKSILSILTLAAGKGTRLEIQTTGPEAAGCLTAICELIERADLDEPPNEPACNSSESH